MGDTDVKTGGPNMMDRRQQPQFTDLNRLLEQLPARVLLDRMPGPVIGVATDTGAVAYANPAVVQMLGHVDGALLGRPLPTLLEAHSRSSPDECMSVLRAASGGEVIDWSHADGYPIHTSVSTPLLLRADDPFLMVYLTDVTEMHWG